MFVLVNYWTISRLLIIHKDMQQSVPLIIDGNRIENILTVKITCPKVLQRRCQTTAIGRASGLCSVNCLLRYFRNGTSQTIFITILLIRIWVYVGDRLVMLT